MSAASTPAEADGNYVDLSWIPLGAGGHCVRASGWMYEAASATARRRRRRPLYHSALQVGHDGLVFAIEMGPSWGLTDPERGVVGGGAVGHPWLGRSRLFRYEVRCWTGGLIPDLSYAVATLRVSASRDRAARVVEVVGDFPTATWGLDEQRTGDMWNSNSLISWLLARSDHDMASIRPPEAGRAPGWAAGLVVAARAHA